MNDAMKHVSHQQAVQLLHNKFVVVLGDSIQRAVYKDLVLLLQKEAYLSSRQLKTKGEMSFEQDCLVEGGCLDEMHNGTAYQEVRQFQSDHHLVRFYFVTRIYSPYMQSILKDFRQGLKPDVVIINSCVWDISRYLPDWIVDYQERLKMFFDELHSVLPDETLIIWNLTMPLGQKIRGGFLVPEIKHKASHLRQDVIEANFYSGTLANSYGMDVLDLHFQFRFSLQHRTADGVHWNALAHRMITSLLLRHSAQAWGVILPCPEATVEVHLSKANDKKEEFYTDAVGYLSFEDKPKPQSKHCKAKPPVHRAKHRQDRHGFNFRPPQPYYHPFYEPYYHQFYEPQHHVMRSRHMRQHYTPYTDHRPRQYAHHYN